MPCVNCEASESAAKILDRRQAIAHTAAFFRTVQEFGQRDGEDGHAVGVGVGVESGQHLL